MAIGFKVAIPPKPKASRYFQPVLPHAIKKGDSCLTAVPSPYLNIQLLTLLLGKNINHVTGRIHFPNLFQVKIK